MLLTNRGPELPLPLLCPLLLGMCLLGRAVRGAVRPRVGVSICVGMLGSPKDMWSGPQLP